jgi:hypothetical protein
LKKKLGEKGEGRMYNKECIYVRNIEKKERGENKEKGFVSIHTHVYKIKEYILIKEL